MKHTHCMILIGVLLVLVIAVAPVAAHAPANLVLSYDPVEGELQATFTHEVADPSTHYIKKVRLEVEGGPDLLEQEYTSQPTTSTYTYTYPLSIDPGTTIRVRGECNIGGEVQRSLLVSGGQNPAETTATSTVTPTSSPSASPTMTTPVTTIPPTTAEAAGFTFPLVFIAWAAAAAMLCKRD
ncbi:MAG: hypothetical protein RQ758_07210 [Methanomicrobiaceae archaeon]|nr:hypothetical protein [Methanomicrobiaceae archaeon]